MAVITGKNVSAVTVVQPSGPFQLAVAIIPFASAV